MLRGKRWCVGWIARWLDRALVGNGLGKRLPPEAVHSRSHHPTNQLTQKGRSSSSSGGPSHAGGPSRGASSVGGGVAEALRRGTGGGNGLGEPSRAGQMTPSQPGPPRSRGLFRHLKSGARGLRFDAPSSHIGPPQTGHSGIPSASARGPVERLWPRAGRDAGLVAAGGAVGLSLGSAARGATTGAPAATAPRGGQITPSHPRSLHLKSGAFGLRLPSRLSHISPPHFGQSGTVLVASGEWGSDMRRSE